MQTPEQIAHASNAAKALIGLPTLMTIAFRGGDLNPIANALLERIQTDQQDASALIDMSIIQVMRGNARLAASMQALALQTQQIYHYPRLTEPVTLRVLAVLGPGDLMANSPFEFLIENQPVALDLLYIGAGQGMPQQIPDHDVLIVAVAESDANQTLLHNLAVALKEWPRPVLNRPECISRLARDTSCALLRTQAGVVMPGAQRAARAVLEACCRPAPDGAALPDQLDGIDYPFIIRPIDSHAGQGLEKIDDLADLTAYLANATDQQFFVSPFVDYRSRDGMYRKYRLILIDGKPYVCHMAISQRWMVHYLNADMLDSAANRAEEAHFMATFDQEFAPRHAAALQAIHRQLGLDYVGMDCAETQDGRMLIFEVDSNMVVHNMDPADLFPYKKEQMPKLFTAFFRMLAARSGQST